MGAQFHSQACVSTRIVRSGRWDLRSSSPALCRRDGLTILLHPKTGNDYADHTEHAVWFGAILPLRLEVLRGFQTTSAAT
jgi:hypothetical protein